MEITSSANWKVICRSSLPHLEMLSHTQVNSTPGKGDNISSINPTYMYVVEFHDANYYMVIKPESTTCTTNIHCHKPN